jgi:hypothetical protein
MISTQMKRENRGGLKARIVWITLILWPFILAALVLGSVRFAVHHSPLIEFYYSAGIYPSIARALSGLSNWFPFSLWDTFWAIVILLVISGFVLVIIRKMKLGRYVLRLIQLLALLYAFFYLVWGFNYFRPKIETRTHWESSQASEKNFRAIFDSIIVHTNLSYTSITPSDYSIIDVLVEESYAKNSVELGIPYPNGTRRPKTMLFSSFFAKSGVSGYFGPFFNEIHLNYYLLPMEYPYVLAHEKAHQFGITNEAEANLAAFVVCITSDDRRLQYSGYVNLLVYFISDAAHTKDVKDFIRKIDKPVIHDLRFQRTHWQGLQNKILDQVQTAANNAYLKTNNIEEGVKNYNQVVSLVIGWYHNKTRANLKSE